MTRDQWIREWLARQISIRLKERTRIMNLKLNKYPATEMRLRQDGSEYVEILKNVY